MDYIQIIIIQAKLMKIIKIEIRIKKIFKI